MMVNHVDVNILAVFEGEIGPGTVRETTRMLSVLGNWKGPGYAFNIDQLVYKGAGADQLCRLNDDFYSQVWLFGAGFKENDNLDGKDLTDEDRKSIKGFMERGGGVFATGDHADIGSRLCARVPRIGMMRSWGGEQSPPQEGDSRADTTAPPLQIEGKDLTIPPQQSASLDTDETPKVIWSRSIERSQPHPLLELPHGASAFPKPIRFLPDHMHEGECREFSTFDSESLAKAREEFDGEPDPQVVAWAMRYGYDKNGSGSAPILHNVIASFEPRSHSALGRAVVDSTFHHWVDTNVDETATTLKEPWRHISQYPINLANWLMSTATLGNIRDAAIHYLSKQKAIAAVLARCGTQSKDRQCILDLGEVLIDTAANLRLSRVMLHRIWAWNEPAPWGLQRQQQVDLLGQTEDVDVIAFLRNSASEDSQDPMLQRYAIGSSYLRAFKEAY